MPLPGRAAVEKPAASGPASAVAVPHRAPDAQRPSAQSRVPFEQARKAEKIFEQALKDRAEGRLSSARMNAKLAAMYDPTVPVYVAMAAELDAQAPDPKASARKPRELELFQEASEAEGRGDYERAVRLLREAVKEAPKAAALRNRLGVVLSVRLKRHGEALEALRVALDLEPGNLVYMNNFSKVTALLDSELGKRPVRRSLDDGKKRVSIRTMRPKQF